MVEQKVPSRLWIGVAGYTGAGKSTVARIFSDLGVPVVNADIVAKRVIREDAAIAAQLREAFGDAVFEAPGCVSFPALRKRVQQSLESLLSLNRIVHPPLVKQLEKMVQNPSAAINVLDAALIPLWGIESWFSLLLWIHADRDLRRNRIVARAGLDVEEAERFMAVQEKVMTEPTDKGWLWLENNDEEEQLRRRLNQITTKQLKLELH